MNKILKFIFKKPSTVLKKPSTVRKNTYIAADADR